MIRPRTLSDRLGKAVFFAAALLSALSIIAIFGFLKNKRGGFRFGIYRTAGSTVTIAESCTFECQGVGVVDGIGIITGFVVVKYRILNCDSRTVIINRAAAFAVEEFTVADL